MKIINQIKRTFEKNKIDFLIFFITTRCNSKCRHCFYWKELNQKDQLKLEEIDKIFSKLGEIRDISLSGGEPILREDIIPIIDIICKYNKPKSISLPSNGIDSKRLFEITSRLVNEYPNLKILINLSLDGPEKVHDNIRGIKGSHKKVVASCKAITKLKKDYKNLYVNINSVITNKNIKFLPNLMKFVRSNLDVDGHYFEIIRGDIKNKDFKILDYEELEKFYRLAIKNEEFYFEKKFKIGKVGLNLGKKVTKIFYIGIIKYLYKTQMKILKGKKFEFDCLAGKTSLVIYPRGDVSLCELRKSIANVKDYNYDIKKIIESESWKKELENIKKENCSCTHNCFIYNTINHNPIIRFLNVPKEYFLK